MLVRSLILAALVVGLLNQSLKMVSHLWSDAQVVLLVQVVNHTVNIILHYWSFCSCQSFQQVTVKFTTWSLTIHYFIWCFSCISRCRCVDGMGRKFQGSSPSTVVFFNPLSYLTLEISHFLVRQSFVIMDV